MEEYDFGEQTARLSKRELPDRVVAVAAGLSGLQSTVQSINDRALWISATTLGGGAAGRPRFGGDASIEPALSRRRVPATDGHVAAK